jgi:prevent-host-death family protein
MPARVKPGTVRPAFKASEQPVIKQVTVHQAKTNLSRLLNDAVAGHTVIIARRDKPIARLEPIEPAKRRVFGALKGKIKFDESFFDALPDDELEAWGER